LQPPQSADYRHVRTDTPAIGQRRVATQLRHRRAPRLLSRGNATLRRAGAFSQRLSAADHGNASVPHQSGSGLRDMAAQQPGAACPRGRLVGLQQRRYLGAGSPGTPTCRCRYRGPHRTLLFRRRGRLSFAFSMPPADRQADLHRGRRHDVERYHTPRAGSSLAAIGRCRGGAGSGHHRNQSSRASPISPDRLVGGSRWRARGDGTCPEYEPGSGHHFGQCLHAAARLASGSHSDVLVAPLAAGRLRRRSTALGEAADNSR